jgi:hypothetical protein
MEKFDRNLILGKFYNPCMVSGKIQQSKFFRVFGFSTFRVLGFKSLWEDCFAKRDYGGIQFIYNAISEATF